MHCFFPSVSFRRLFLAAAGVGLALLLLPQTATAQTAAPDVQVPDTADAVLRVNGLACSACARRMKGTLEDVEGVDHATVLLEKQNVVLTLSGQQTPSAKLLREAVTSAGYEFRSAVFATGRTEEGSGQ